MNAMTVEKPSKIAHFSDNIQGLIQEKKPTNVINAAKPSVEALGLPYPDNTYWRETLYVQ